MAVVAYALALLSYVVIGWAGLVVGSVTGFLGMDGKGWASTAYLLLWIAGLVTGTYFYWS